jgi:hypothetical protein
MDIDAAKTPCCAYFEQSPANRTSIGGDLEWRAMVRESCV